MKKIILNIALVAIAFSTSFKVCAQKVRTIAGNNTMGYSGDGGVATGATLGASWGIAADGQGNLFVADDDANVIRKIHADGTIETIAGTGYPGYSGDGAAATSARLNYPSGLAVDGIGNLYLADNGNYAIRKIDLAGNITTVVGDGSGLRGNSGDGGPAVSARLAGCVALTFDKYNNMYIADGNGKIRKMNTVGMISTVAGSSLWGFSGDGAAATAAAMAGPSGVAVDSLGNIYIADQLNNVIRKVDAAGIITTIAGTTTSGFSGDGGQATSARINTPGGIIIDKRGNIYFADEGNNRVRKVNAAGIISTVAGDGTWSYGGDGGLAVNAAMKMPSAVCLNTSGNLFIADRSNYVVREVVNREALVISANPGSTVMAGTVVTFTVPTGGNNYGLAYQWQRNGLNVGSNSPTYTSATVNNGDVMTCKLVDPAYSTALETSDDFTMMVTPLATPTVINNNVSIDMSLYPNPNQGNFEFNCTVHSAIDEYVFYGVYDVTGKLLYDGSGNTTDRVMHGKVNMKTPLPPGQYTLLVSANNAKNMIHFEIN